MNKQYKVKACVVYNIGKSRSNHEDNYLLDDGRHINEAEQEQISHSGGKSEKRFYPGTITGNCIFVVSDGMGGHNAGEVASRITVEQLQNMKEYIFRTPDAQGIKSRFQDYIAKANTVIALKASQNPELKGMGATLTGIILCHEGAIALNLGDSRTYLFKGGILKRLTRDHTEGQQLVDSGRIKEEEMHLIEGSKAITRYMGIDDKYYVQSADLGDTIIISGKTWFLICSDGLTDVIEEKEIRDILMSHFPGGNMEQAASYLTERALEGRGKSTGGIDNITVLIVEVKEYIPSAADKARAGLESLIKLVINKA